MPDENKPESQQHSRPRWQTIGLIAVALSFALAVTGCSSGGSGSDTTTTSNSNTTASSSSDTSAASAESACNQAFSQAASISDMQDTVEDLYPAIRACKTVDEWSAASAAHPDALDGADPIVFLTNACRYADVSDIEQTVLCQSLG